MFGFRFMYAKKVIFRLVILMKAFPRNLGYIIIFKSLPGGGGDCVFTQYTYIKSNYVLFSRQYKK